ncbi:MAG: hypothetical protein GXP24_14370 [Planctomycetes bacterium]|nr:hypothetical protein [Planctomycetota bacterium]
MTFRIFFRFRISTLLLLMAAAAVVFWLNIRLNINSVDYQSVSKPSWEQLEVRAYKGWPLAHFEYRSIFPHWDYSNPAKSIHHPIDESQDYRLIQQHMSFSIRKFAVNAIIGILAAFLGTSAVCFLSKILKKWVHQL